MMNDELKRQFHHSSCIMHLRMVTENPKVHQSSSPDKKLTTVDKLRMLHDITKKISRSLDLEELLTLVMDTLSSLIPYDAAGIYLIETEEDSEIPYIFKSKALRGYDISFEADRTATQTRRRFYRRCRTERKIVDFAGCQSGRTLFSGAAADKIGNGRADYRQ